MSLFVGGKALRCFLLQCNMHVNCNYACLEFKRAFIGSNACNWSFTLNNILAAQLYPHKDHPSGTALKKGLWLGPYVSITSYTTAKVH